MAGLKPLWLSVGPLSERLHRTDTLDLGLDFDGTLTEIAADPSQAVLPGRARDVLGRLATHPGVRLAFLSSRALDDLRERVGIEHAFYAGCSGLETCDEQGRRETHVDPGAALPPALVQELESWCPRFPGARLEARSGSCTLHFHAVDAHLQPAFGAGVRRRIRPHAHAVTLVHGRAAFEVMPANGWDKAAAFERWVGSGRPAAVVFYFGDDTRDEPVYDIVRQRGGIAVAVRRIVSRAEYGMPTPGDVLWFLEWLEREWAQRHADSGCPARPELQTAAP